MNLIEINSFIRIRGNDATVKANSNARSGGKQAMNLNETDWMKLI